MFIILWDSLTDTSSVTKVKHFLVTQPAVNHKHGQRFFCNHIATNKLQRGPAYAYVAVPAYETSSLSEVP